jgi:hypothetical protein
MRGQNDIQRAYLSRIATSPVEPAALDAMTPMRNDLRRCDGRKKDIKELRKSNAPLQSS